MADLDAAFVQQVLYIPKRERETDIEHHRQANNLGARLEVAKGAAFCHPAKLDRRPAQLKSVSSDNTLIRFPGTNIRAILGVKPPQDYFIEQQLHDR